VFGAEVFMASTNAWVNGCSTEYSGLLVSVVAGRGSVDACGWVVCVCVWFGWLFELWQGPDLRPLGMSLQLKAPLQVSSWVAFHACSLELTNGGRQC
jgi:hypothetical protein